LGNLGLDITICPLQVITDKWKQHHSRRKGNVKNKVLFMEVKVKMLLLYFEFDGLLVVFPRNNLLILV